ncbi:MAG: hypothetical protein CBD18_05100 [Opitutales bacterium TMED158]|nr:MAG: hypothetical protein CBD18_05100 [Opitutales bacterium TMED158]
MERINPDSRFNPATSQNRLANSPKSDAKATDASAPATKPLKPGYAEMFDDKELERLQNNLESIADMAGKALDRIKK